jgi:hypothetical protein
MANIQLKGLRPVSNGVGETAPRITHYTVPATYATAIGEGCVLYKSATGARLHAGTTASTHASIIGVAAHYVPAAPAAAGYTQVAVYDDENQEFEAMMDDNTINTALELEEVVGQFVSITSNTANATSGQAKTTLDGDTVTSVLTTNTAVCHIKRMVTDPNNTGSTTNTRFVVKFANHLWVKSTTNATVES